MNLLTLNLHKRLAWSLEEAAKAGLATFHEAFRACEASSESSETALAWDWDDAVDSVGADGPRARAPLPRPSRVAVSGPSGGDYALEPGTYLFVQTRAPGGSDEELERWLASVVEWFAREAWWTKAATAGPLVVRLVREDGKTAVQLLRRLI